MRFFITILLILNALPSAALALPTGASLYIEPPFQNPNKDSNFNLIVKVDSPEYPINAISGVLNFDTNRLQLVNVSYIGSIVKIWVEEPRFSNSKGILTFQGGIPGKGFTGSGGHVFSLIFRAKQEGVTSLIWEEGTVLSADGNGTNVLNGLGNLNFAVEPSYFSDGNRQGSDGQNTLIIVVGGTALLLIGMFFIGKFLLKYHDMEIHHIYRRKRKDK